MSMIFILIKINFNVDINNDELLIFILIKIRFDIDINNDELLIIILKHNKKENYH